MAYGLLCGEPGTHRRGQADFGPRNGNKPVDWSYSIGTA